MVSNFCLSTATFCFGRESNVPPSSLDSRKFQQAARVSLIDFLLILLLFPASAQAVAPNLASIIPTGGQRGVEMEVSFNGDRLQDAEEIICYEPGLQILKLSVITNKV